MRYRLLVREIHMQRVAVEADSPIDALRKFNSGLEANSEDVGSPEYSHVDSIACVEDEQGNVVLTEEQIEEEDLP